MAAELFSIESSAGKHAGQCIFRVSGPLNSNTESKFLERLRAEIAPTVILDLSNVHYSDSRGIAALAQIYNAFKLEKRQLALVGLHPKVLHVMEITRVLGLFTVFATLEEAEEALV